jgi:hypothetical protein
MMDLQGPKLRVGASLTALLNCAPEIDSGSIWRPCLETGSACRYRIRRFSQP